MANRITMPQLGESITEGTISRWLKQEGEWIQKDEPLVEIITDKVTAEMPSPVAGMLSRILVQEGEVVPVGQDLAEIEDADEATADIRDQAAVTSSTGAPAEALRDAMWRRLSDYRQVVELARKRSSPLVRRLAFEHGIDISTVQGTGIDGRITKNDILNLVAKKTGIAPSTKDIEEDATPLTTEAALSQATALTSVHAVERVAPVSPVTPSEVLAPPSTAPGSAPPIQYPPAQAETPLKTAVQPPPSAKGDQFLPLTPMRRLIAEHMVRSKHISPHATTMHEVDMTNVVKWRETMKGEFQRREGISLTYLPFVLKATIEALKAFPIINSSWGDDKIVLKKQINVGIAVALDDGLIVPVIHEADKKSIAGLAIAANDLATRAKAGKLTLDDVQGATFTLNNTGTFGSIVSLPIINQPQAAILSMEAIVKRPVVIDDAIAIRSMMYLCLSFDHRILDGYSAGKFVQRIRQWLEGFGASVPLY
ncbi:MAG: 2-oxo acid dehydrogenase subunit E2 [Chloroflexi bacterium]|nr:2-oxo acid dehydrogenase subunit E2 [Chloroflexota bacterium]